MSHFRYEVDDRVATITIDRTGEMLEQCFRSNDHTEGVAAFLERRPANITGA